ncbi:hypothetical protein FQN60_003302 [Etheostoma spectabile]|uniref:Complex 1 LYR protein domain-containing protein n=1 Tax=Etheostoma spectabile TaxID=54343 RepID=A0A5J5CPE5_9PERO|nr:hypothetical protein FQN60_003302 [Etheostoma spectabile]
MTSSTRSIVLSLYTRVFRIARSWQAQSGVASDTERERQYILQEACTLFRQNQQLTDPESINRCIEECEARIEIGKSEEMPHISLHKSNPTQVYITGTHIQGLRTYHQWDWQLRKAGRCERNSAGESRPSQYTYSHMTTPDAR